MNLARNVTRRDFLRCSAALSAAIGATGSLPTLTAAENPAQGKWQLGCFTRPFAEFDYAQTLQGIAEAGFSTVGLMSVRLPEGAVTLPDATAQQTTLIRKMTGDAGLTVAATYYSGPPVAKTIAEGVDAMRKLIDNCAAVGCPAVVMGGTGKQELYDAYYTAVAGACEHASQHGVSLVLKPHGGLNATGPQCLAAVEKVAHPACQLWYDPGNIYYYSDGRIDPVEDVASVASRVTGMCVKDFLPPKNVAVNPGSGKVDFPALMARLQEGGFTGGPLVVETLAPGDFKATVANARAAHAFLQRILA